MLHPGTFRLINKSGRQDNKVDASTAAVISLRWNYEGSALATAGEDGSVKVWSRNGMLRSVLATTTKPVYAVCWGPDSDQVLYSAGGEIVQQSVQVDRKQLKWKAHDGVVMAMDWNPVNNLIVSGGEDCLYVKGGGGKGGAWCYGGCIDSHHVVGCVCVALYFRLAALAASLASLLASTGTRCGMPLGASSSRVTPSSTSSPLSPGPSRATSSLLVPSTSCASATRRAGPTRGTSHSLARCTSWPGPRTAPSWAGQAAAGRWCLASSWAAPWSGTTLRSA